MNATSLILGSIIEIKTDSPIAVLSAVLTGAGSDASDFQIALQAISDAQERRESENTEAKCHNHQLLSALKPL